jgi:hypothetical protein
LESKNSENAKRGPQENLESDIKTDIRPNNE